MNKLFVASNNIHKIGEIANILALNNLNIELVSPKDFDDKQEPIEDGKTFEENAYIKASYYYEKYKLPTIADDSGLCIDYFNGLPGIYSARFLSNLDYKKKNDYVLDLMKDIKNRKATFVAYICYIDETGAISYFKGENKGEIALQAKGNEGFGYDPIFFIPKENKTEAELGQNYKDTYSHRAMALKEWINYVKKK